MNRVCLKFDMHFGKRTEKIKGRGLMGKAIVFGLPDRETGKVRTSVVGMRRNITITVRFARTLKVDRN